jgi:predicted Holliday junction resolvase-like endonuclease
MSALEVTLGVLLMVAVITIVWLVVGGRFIMRRLERQIRALQVSERNALHLAHLWQKRVKEIEDVKAGMDINRRIRSTLASLHPKCTPLASTDHPTTITEEEA